MADIETLRASVAALSESHALLDRAAHALFVHDGDGVDDWDKRTEAFKDIYRSEIVTVFRVVDDQLAAISRGIAA